jgi:hypothetical protein
MLCFNVCLKCRRLGWSSLNKPFLKYRLCVRELNGICCQEFLVIPMFLDVDFPDIFELNTGLFLLRPEQRSATSRRYRLAALLSCCGPCGGKLWDVNWYSSSEVNNMKPSYSGCFTLKMEATDVLIALVTTRRHMPEPQIWNKGGESAINATRSSVYFVLMCWRIELAFIFMDVMSCGLRHS